MQKNTSPRFRKVLNSNYTADAERYVYEATKDYCNCFAALFS